MSGHVQGFRVCHDVTLLEGFCGERLETAPVSLVCYVYTLGNIVMETAVACDEGQDNTPLFCSHVAGLVFL